jgi:hypothetical protein
MEEAKIDVKDEGVKGAPLAVPQGSGFFSVSAAVPKPITVKLLNSTRPLSVRH